MKRIIHLLVRYMLTIIFTAIILWAVDQYSGQTVGEISTKWFFVETTKYDPYLTFGFLAVVLFICNTILKKILQILTLPLRRLTLGLFSFVLNVLILYIFQYIINTGDFGMTIYLGDWIQVLILSFFVMIPNILAKLFK